MSPCRGHQQCEARLHAAVPRSAMTGAGGSSSVLDDGSRMIVVSWLVEVAEEFGLQQETLHASVCLLDRFLATSQVGDGCCWWMLNGRSSCPLPDVPLCRKWALLPM